LVNLIDLKGLVSGNGLLSKCTEPRSITVTVELSIGNW